MSVAGILASNLFSNALSSTAQKSLPGLASSGSTTSSRATGAGSFAEQLLQQGSTPTSGSTQSAKTSHVNGVAPVALSSTPISSLSLAQTQLSNPDTQAQALQAYSTLQQNSMNSYLGNWLNASSSLSVNA